MNKLIVYLNSREVGHLEVDPEGRLSFQYARDWVADERAYPLSKSLPLRPDPFLDKQARPFFAGVLPEQDVRERVAAVLGISARNDFELLDRIGGECAGAVALLPDGVPYPSADQSGLRRLTEEQFRNVIEELPRRPLLAGEKDLRLSLAGAQNKLPVVLDEDGVALPLGNTPSTHIVKPEPARFPGLATNEMLVMGLARAVGLAVPDADLRHAGSTPYLVVKRYDRQTSPDGTTERIHQEDFCQALGVPPERKYQQEGGPIVRDCVALLRTWSTTPVVDIRAFVDGLIFSFVVGNADAHGKNFSFLYQAKQRRLAPFYDLICTLAWPELSQAPAMKIGSGKSLADMAGGHFRQMAQETNLGWPMVRERITHLSEGIRQALQGYSFPAAMDQQEARRVSQIILARAEKMLAHLGL